MTFQPLPSRPGVIKDDSPLEAGLHWTDADKVRFVAGLPETIYGWEKVTTAALLGLCRGLVTYADNARNPLAALGTHLRLYAMDVDGNVTDITPVSGYSQASVNFTTAIASAVVTITGWTHGLLAEQKFKLENATVATVGGVTINGMYTVLTVESATSITFTAAQGATSSAGPTAATVDITVYLAPGQADGLGGIGFGTGGYGSGGYGGSSASVTLYPRTWALAPWGQNLLANPRGGGIYEWAPNTSATELVTNGDFTTAAGWTAGTGWTIGAGVATASAGTGSNLSTNVTCAVGAWHLLQFNASIGAGSVQAKHGASTIGTASASGLHRMPFFAGGGTNTVVFSKDTAFAGTLDNVSLKVLTTAQLVTGAPTQVTQMFVTDQRTVVAVGSNLDGVFDALQIDWSDAEDNQTWNPTSANLAGGFTLPDGGRAVAGKPGNGENVIWTNDCLWTMRYNGNPASVFDFDRKGRECGLIGPNAAVQAGNAWYWMSPAGAFFRYDGASIVPLPCTVARDVRDNLAWVQGDKVYARSLMGKNYAEAWWFIPDSRDGAECSRYVMVDTKDPSIWSCGTWNITAACAAAAFEYPLAVDDDGYIWFHEKGFSADGGARSWSLTGAYRSEIGGNIIVNGVRPDADDVQGGYAITLAAKNRDVRGIFTRIYPTLNVTAATGQRTCRVQGEQVNVTFNGTSAPAFWRLGSTLLDIIQSTRKR